MAAATDPRKQGEEGNPLLVVGVYNKEITYDRYPRMPDSSWAARAYTFGAIDPSLGQAMSFPSLLQLKLRIEVPLWRDVAEAKHPSPDSQVEESDTDSPASGSRERSPRYVQPVPVGGVELPEVETEVATEEEDTVAEPTCAFARGFGQFVIRYTRLATALGNFEQGSIQTESTAVAYWLTSGLKVAMARVGWNLLSPRYGLTRLPGELLKHATTPKATLNYKKKIAHTTSMVR